MIQTAKSEIKEKQESGQTEIIWSQTPAPSQSKRAKINSDPKKDEAIQKTGNTRAIAGANEVESPKEADECDSAEKSSFRIGQESRKKEILHLQKPLLEKNGDLEEKRVEKGQMTSAGESKKDLKNEDFKEKASKIKGGDKPGLGF